MGVDDGRVAVEVGGAVADNVAVAVGVGVEVGVDSGRRWKGMLSST